MAGKLIYFHYDFKEYPNKPRFNQEVVDLDKDTEAHLATRLFGEIDPNQTIVVVADGSRGNDDSTNREVPLLEVLAQARGMKFYWYVDMESMVHALICVDD